MARFLLISEARDFWDDWKHMLNALGVEELFFAWHGQHRRHIDGYTTILEAIASHGLKIWHSFFDMADS
jgi:hypothetical protein